jgi:hypothetical protein
MKKKYKKRRCVFIEVQEMQSFMTISDDGNFQFSELYSEFLANTKREFVKCNQRLFIPCRAENIILIFRMPTASSYMKKKSEK